MRILQLIDSLEAGGAEQMAVNYANALADEIDFSGLIATRKEGVLVEQIHSNVSYLFLNRKRAVDIKALFQLHHFVKKNKVEVIHAHSTSFFVAVCLKLIQPKIKLLWHDHYGNSDFIEQRKSFFLQLCIPFFYGILVVNQKLKIWVKERLHFKNVIYLPNFVLKKEAVFEKTFLKGQDGKRIVCLANLRAQKNHLLLLEVAKKLKESHTDWTFHLVGKDFNDGYSSTIKKWIEENNLEDTVFLYGTRQDVGAVLEQATIGVLSSKSEGLPVALLEYGLYKVPVVVTAVGDIPMLIKNGVHGFLIMDFEKDTFYNTLVRLMESEQLQRDFAEAFHKKINEEFTAIKVMQQYLVWLKKEEI